VQSLPSGTVTFLFTDIQGSTRMTQELGDRWPPLLQRHHAILRQAIEANDGVVFGTEGDAVFAAFGSAPRGVAAAIAGQRALAAEDWPDGTAIKVRMGLHTGEGTVSGETYVGIDVHRAARIAAAGHGGQVLISAATRMLAEANLPEGVTLEDLGEHRLKDLSRPEHISQLVIAGLPSSFPPIRSLNEVPNNLPTQLTSFVGRDQELAEAARLLADARLLTLTGPGGTGKTRLALQLAADATEQFADGVYFVPLGPIGEASLVMPTIAQAVGVSDPGGRPLDRLAEQLNGKRVLLVLDNFEQVLEAVPDVGELLTRVSTIKVLATSRSPLHVYGEQEYPVPPLGLPDTKHLPDLDALSQYAAVALFVERAMAVRPGFRVDVANAPAIAEICVRLDGLPLAIELAAARVKVLAPQAIMSRLGDRLSLLAGGSRYLPERQQTLRGAIDWSHDLLEDRDRIVFARFSAFAGGADVDAVQAVVLEGWPDDAPAAPDVLDALDSLVDKSLVRQAMSADGEPRFQMLETIRDYATERLDEREPDGATRLRHAEHYLRVAEDVASRIFGPDQRGCLDTLEREHDNLRAAINFAVAGGRAELAMRLLSASWRFWQMRGYLAEARERAERILALPDTDAHKEVLLHALDAAGGIAYWQGDLKQAVAWYEAEEHLAAELGDRKTEAEALYNQAMSINIDVNLVERAMELARRARAIFVDLGDRHGEGRAIWGMVQSSSLSDDPTGLRNDASLAVEIFREQNDAFMLAWALYTRALMNFMTGEDDAAEQDLREALAIFQKTNDVSGYALILDAFATLEWKGGNRDRAMRIAGAAATLQDLSGVGLAQRNRAIAEFFPQDLLNEAPLADAYAAGQKLTTEQAIQVALHQDETEAPA
jgi:predicted ATPase/class 3 adenylate cyclase